MSEVPMIFLAEEGTPIGFGKAQEAFFSMDHERSAVSLFVLYSHSPNDEKEIPIALCRNETTMAAYLDGEDLNLLDVIKIRLAD